MALDDSELDPDEVNLDVKEPSSWDKARQHWTVYLTDWENEIYYPIFAPRGISKGHALSTYVIKTEVTDVYNLLVHFLNKDDDGDSWKPPQS